METAAIVTGGLLDSVFAKTAHGLIRGPSRYRLLGVVDPLCAGRDAGEVLDGHERGVAVFDSLAALEAGTGERPAVCVVGVATVGGVLPAAVRQELLAAAKSGVTLVSGLHQLLADDVELARCSEEGGGQVIDLRRPRPASELRFWSGEVLEIATPRIAILGTDCAVGKRTTAGLLVAECRARGMRTQLVYTGQTGWLQGYRHGFILDATPNDFVCGELERAILECERESAPDLILLEGQASLRNPSGPCGSELLLAGGACGVVLQHAPGRKYFEGLEDLGIAIPALRDELRMVELLGSEVWAVTLNGADVPAEELVTVAREWTAELGVPVVLPLEVGVEGLVDHLLTKLPRPGAS